MGLATDSLATSEQSPLRGALLALLLQGPSHGYQLANRLERQLGPGWQITRTTLYRTLEKLNGDGLLLAEEPGTARSRIVYCVTGRAEGAVQSWMESPLSLDEGQLQLQARMIVARLEDLPRILVAVNGYERSLFSIHAALGTQGVSADTKSLRSAMMKLVRQASRHRIEAELSWLVEVRDTIMALMQ